MLCRYLLVITVASASSYNDQWLPYWQNMANTYEVLARQVTSTISSAELEKKEVEATQGIHELDKAPHKMKDLLKPITHNIAFTAYTHDVFDDEYRNYIDRLADLEAAEKAGSSNKDMYQTETGAKFNHWRSLFTPTLPYRKRFFAAYATLESKLKHGETLSRSPLVKKAKADMEEKEKKLGNMATWLKSLLITSVVVGVLVTCGVMCWYRVRS
jgi:hypothetical protein